MKWFELPKNLIPKLKELQSKDLPEKMVQTEDAVVMFYGMGDPMYLTLDGRILIDECFMEDKGLREAENLIEAAMAVVVGAKVRNFPELLSILPARPENAIDCQNCEKTGWFMAGEVLGPFVCGKCGGLGWKLKENE
jgi:ribosomal protein S27AE